MNVPICIVGGGLAGCEAALWLASQGIRVDLYEQKPFHFSAAHSSENLAELVCSNSFKAQREDSAAGLLKAEMRILGSRLLPIADSCRVPAGGALAVERHAFSAAVTHAVLAEKNIQLIRTPFAGLLEIQSPVIVASGPLTEGVLAQQIQQLTGEDNLSFHDAAAPIITAESIDRSRVFAAARYGRGEDDYINCPFNKAEYELFHSALVQAKTAPLRDFEEKITVYEGCMPVEILAKRGLDSLRYGPLRPVGLLDPRTGHRPWANVQLRQEDLSAMWYNLVGFQTNLLFGEQKRVFSMIPGLENAEFVRYGVMHRNTFINSPRLLSPSLQLQKFPNIMFAGQITGVEGYMESAASALIAARTACAVIKMNKIPDPLPPETICGALNRYITSTGRDFQPMGANMGLLPPMEETIKDKRLRYRALADRALSALQKWEQDAEKSFFGG